MVLSACVFKEENRAHAISPVTIRLTVQSISPLKVSSLGLRCLCTRAPYNCHRGYQPFPFGACTGHHVPIGRRLFGRSTPMVYTQIGWFFFCRGGFNSRSCLYIDRSSARSIIFGLLWFSRQSLGTVHYNAWSSDNAGNVVATEMSQRLPRTDELTGYNMFRGATAYYGSA